MLILHRPRFAFKSSNRGVVVERDHKAVACGARPLQKFDMTRVEVEAPVRQSHFQAFRLPIGDNRGGGIVDDFRIVTAPCATQNG